MTSHRFGSADGLRRLGFWLVVGIGIGWLDGVIAIVLWPWHHATWFDRFGTFLVGMFVGAGFVATLSVLAEVPARLLARLGRVSAEAWHRGCVIGGGLLIAAWVAVLKLQVGGGEAGWGRGFWMVAALIGAIAIAGLLAVFGRRRIVAPPRIAASRWIGALASALVAAAVLSTWHRSGAAQSGDSHPNVVFISIDTLRADHLGLYGYARDTSPNIDALGREAMVFENAYPQSNWTLPSHASMFTGLDPLAHGVTAFDGILSERHLTLAERLRDSGYRTVAWVGRHRYSYIGSARGLAQGFLFYEHSPHANRYRSGTLPRLIDEAVYHYNHKVGRATAEIDAVLRWLRAPPSQPFFAFIHLDDVHSQTHRLPYDAPRPFRDRFCPEKLDGYSGCVPGGPCATKRLQAIKAGTFPLQPGELERIECLYDGAVAFMDHEVGRLVEGMREQGLLDRAIFILTADHGEALFEHGQALHESLYEPVARVPLLIRLPGGRPAGRRAGLVELIDLVPTILKLAGTESPGALPGDVLIDASKPHESAGADEAFVVGRPPSLSLVLRAGDLKFIEHPAEPDELYDLAVDPGETHNLEADHDARRQPLQRELERRVRLSDEIRRALLGDFEQETLELPDAEQEHLRDLGYLE